MAAKRYSVHQVGIWLRETLWCFGIPGAGKTVLASIVVDYLRTPLQNKKSIGVAVAYLNHKETDMQSPSNIIAGLWWQLVSETISDPVQQLYLKHRHQRTRPSLREVCDIFRSTVAEYSKVYIIVDALDEYPERWRRVLLDALAESRTACLMLTARSHVAPNDFFPDAQVLKIGAKEDDIRRYVEAQIRNSPRLLKHIKDKPELGKDIETKIVGRNIDGMFLLIKLHMDSLASKTSVKAVKDALENLPEDLDKTYDEAMDRIESQKKDEKDVARRAIIWVANVKRPLLVSELQEALAIQPGTRTLDRDSHVAIDIVVSLCAGLIIVDRADNTVRFIHYTTQSYLDLDTVRASRFPQAQTEITLQCLTYLSLDKFVDLPLSSILRGNSLLVYARDNCLVHAAGQPELLARESILSFLGEAARWAEPSSTGMGRTSPWKFKYWPTSPSKLFVAALFDLQNIARHLLETSQVEGKKDEIPPLAVASYYGHIGMVKLLLENGEDANAVAAMLGTPLNVAISHLDTALAQLLLDNGADVNAQGRSYLASALGSGNEEMTQLLIEKGADVNVQLKWYDANPLQYASRKGYGAVVRLLLEKGADVNAKGGFHGNALSAGSERGHIEVVRLLLKHGADVNAQGGRYRTAFRAAKAKGRSEIVQLLLDHGADTRTLAEIKSVEGDLQNVFTLYYAPPPPPPPPPPPVRHLRLTVLARHFVMFSLDILSQYLYLAFGVR
ncbi:ankyrin repeat-containing domain protein [Mycena vulgaris]|nr:ankyrin repeat-containing domain protein [Mycena vulgaris]